MNVSMPIAAVMLDLGFPARDGQGGADPRAHGRPARPPRRGARAAARLPDGGRGRGRRSLRGAMTDAEAYDDAARLPARALGVLPREARRPRHAAAGSPRSRAAADHEAGAARRPSRRRTRSARTCAPSRAEIVRIYSTSGTTGDAELHPAHRLRPRELDRDLGALLRRLGRAAGRADRLDLQRRPVRGGRRAGRVRADRPHATSRSAPATPSGCCARSSCCAPTRSC